MKKSHESPRRDNTKTFELSTKISRFCVESRVELDSIKVQDDTDVENCYGLVKGLEALQRGVSKHYFVDSWFDSEPQHKKLFNFSCFDSLNGNLKYFQGELVPSEVRSFLATPKVGYLTPKKLL